MRPLLEVLRENGEMYRHDAIDAVVKKMNLTQDQLAEKQISNGRSIAKGRVGWASSYLRVAGALIGPRRSYFALGPNAEKLLSLNRQLTENDLLVFKEYQDHQERKIINRGKNNEVAEVDQINDDTPQDLIDRGIKRIREQLIDELLDHIKNISPSAFENLILQVLEKMGYGGGDKKRIKGVSPGPDGGIDGTIDEDKLGLDQIYIQAKRYY